MIAVPARGPVRRGNAHATSHRRAMNRGRVTSHDRATSRVHAMSRGRAMIRARAMNPGLATNRARERSREVRVPVVRPSRLAALVLAGLCMSGASMTRAAASEEALANFEQAKAAFEAEDYSRARALLELALAEGLQGPAIHYNLGAAAYRGGDLPRAERAFMEVARTPSMAALAYYNLGLVALERNDDAEARDWFTRALQATPDPPLADLASRRLTELPEARAPGFWSYYSRGGVGYDDNVSLRSDSIEGAASGDTQSLSPHSSRKCVRWPVSGSAGSCAHWKASKWK